jgi:hypothetical protein
VLCEAQKLFFLLNSNCLVYLFMIYRKKHRSDDDIILRTILLWNRSIKPLKKIRHNYYVLQVCCFQSAAPLCWIQGYFNYAHFKNSYNDKKRAMLLLTYPNIITSRYKMKSRIHPTSSMAIKKWSFCLVGYDVLFYSYDRKIHTQLKNEACTSWVLFLE